jgi:hypothetical protein
MESIAALPSRLPVRFEERVIDPSLRLFETIRLFAGEKGEGDVCQGFSESIHVPPKFLDFGKHVLGPVDFRKGLINDAADHLAFCLTVGLGPVLKLVENVGRKTNGEWLHVLRHERGFYGHSYTPYTLIKA